MRNSIVKNCICPMGKKRMKHPLTFLRQSDKILCVKREDEEETALAAHREELIWWKSSARCGGRTTSEQPGTTGTGPPVTEVTSDGFFAVSRVEPWNA